MTHRHHHYTPVYNFRDPACPADYNPEYEEDLYDRVMERRFEERRERDELDE